MCKTNLKLVGEDRWGNSVSWPIYSDNRELCVAIRKRSGLRRTMVPYRSFARTSLSHFYVIEGG